MSCGSLSPAIPTDIRVCTRSGVGDESAPALGVAE